MWNNPPGAKVPKRNVGVDKRPGQGNDQHPEGVKVKPQCQQSRTD